MKTPTKTSSAQRAGCTLSFRLTFNTVGQDCSFGAADSYSIRRSLIPINSLLYHAHLTASPLLYACWTGSLRVLNIWLRRIMRTMRECRLNLIENLMHRKVERRYGRSSSPG